MTRDAFSYFSPSGDLTAKVYVYGRNRKATFRNVRIVKRVMRDVRDGLVPFWETPNPV